MKGLSSAQVAAREAREEAGLVGRVSPDCIGSFELERLRLDAEKLRLIDVHPLFVEKQVPNWDGKSQRTVLRCDITSPLSLVCSQTLAGLIAKFSYKIGDEIAFPPS